MVCLIFLVFWNHEMYVCLHLKIEYTAHALEGVSGEKSFITLLLMNSFNKSEAVIFPMQTMRPEDYLFSQINYHNTAWHVSVFLPAFSASCVTSSADGFWPTSCSAVRNSDVFMTPVFSTSTSWNADTNADVMMAKTIKVCVPTQETSLIDNFKVKIQTLVCEIGNSSWAILKFAGDLQTAEIGWRQFYVRP